MGNSAYILAVDQSTSGTKALVFDEGGAIVSRADRAHEQKISSRGWVAHDPEEIYGNTIRAAAESVKQAGIDPSLIRGIGISNHRETAMVWDRETGRPVYDAVVWHCARGQAVCEAIADHGESIRLKTGLRLSPYFSAAKIAWILDHTNNRENKNLCAGTVDSWLVYKLTGNFRTDYSNASRTQLFNINDLVWDTGLCELFGVDRGMLPEVCDSNSRFGETNLEGLLPRPVPVHAVMGDSHAALFGHGCLEKAEGKVTYGTGSSVMINLGPKAVFCNNVVTSLAWGTGGKVDYVLEGNINYSGAVIRWLVDDVKLLGSSKEAGELAAQANPEDTTCLVPAFSGLGAPYWKSDAKACLWGMSRTTGKAEIVKAAEESIACQIRDVVKAVEEESGILPSGLYADGGPAKDTFLMQFQSDMLDMPLSVSSNEEISATGAAWMAGMALGLYSSGLFESKKTIMYTPKMNGLDRERKLYAWHEAIKKVTGL
jgi:glycerol kinase